MKKSLKFIIPLIVFLAIVAGLLCWLGIGKVASGSAIANLKDELVSLHGESYTGKQTEAGTESMTISVEPMDYFPSNRKVRSFFEMDTHYECKVVYTLEAADGSVTTRTVSYIGIDPGSQEQIAVRAYIDLSTKKES